MSEDGNVRITGRAKEMIIRGGENIYPREIEEFLHAHPKIAGACVVGLPDERLGERVLAWVQLKSGGKVWSAGGKWSQERRDTLRSNGKEEDVSRRQFTKEFKMEAVRRMQSGESASALARELEVKRSKLYDWCAAWERYGEQAFPGPGRRPGGAPRVERGRESEAKLAALERKIGQQAIEIDFLTQALQRVEDLRRPSIVSGGSGSAK